MKQGLSDQIDTHINNNFILCFVVVPHRNSFEKFNKNNIYNRAGSKLTQ